MIIPFSSYDFFGYLANGFLIVCATEYAFLGTSLAERDWKVGHAVFYAVLSYIIGHIVAHISSCLLEHCIVRKKLGSPEKTLFEPQQKTWQSFFFPNFYHPFPPETQARVLEVARKNGYADPGRGLFLHAHTVAKQDKATLDRLASFLNLYGFCRNISTGLIISAVILAIGALIDVRHWTPIDEYKLAWAGAALVGAVGMFYRYLKFFRLYTMEVFNSYAELKQEKPATPGPGTPT
jgi:hypothetical protein